ncbi:PTS IIA-like nitrogen regulatory protein PtsN [Parahalioglobus pacificus]|uniref:Nitrogen regulatory protein n=1 Tax=Parahalioglobus pacificus TaxID=930806 RepID=A0A918XC42_9GAMM|nr:PTS IIA-like nitrogen regulatory protein PtsN [Halioglobus pacificus]NQY02149.1 PTS IIA-like nitrogen regulatory protein PtsN [Halieaceae bacterium]GHD25788.1 nitrogen regulatory protein [Halioglobus pacificus]
MDVLKQLLTPGRTLCKAPGASKKRLLQTVAQLIAEDQISLDATELFTQLVAREKLGSTGLGDGIAIPHCRIENCVHPLGTLVTLDKPVPFDSPDGQPVDLMFVLLVPDEAHQEHLDILASLARLFSQTDFCDTLRSQAEPAQLYQTAVNWPG